MTPQDFYALRSKLRGQLRQLWKRHRLVRDHLTLDLADGYSPEDERRRILAKIRGIESELVQLEAAKRSAGIFDETPQLSQGVPF